MRYQIELTESKPVTTAAVIRSRVWQPGGIIALRPGRVRRSVVIRSNRRTSAAGTPYGSLLGEGGVVEVGAEVSEPFSGNERIHCSQLPGERSRPPRTSARTKVSKDAHAGHSRMVRDETTRILRNLLGDFTGIGRKVGIRIRQRYARMFSIFWTPQKTKRPNNRAKRSRATRPKNMDTRFPFHTAAWIVLNMIILGARITIILHRSFTRNTINPGAKRKWTMRVIIYRLLAWFAARMILGRSRLIAPALLIPASFFVLYATVALAMAFSPIFRRAALSIPQNEPIGLHIVRVAGFVLLVFLDMRLLPAEFAQPAGYGDILVAMTAPLALYALSENKPFGRGLAIAWNFLGILDFVIALVTGTLFIGPYVGEFARHGRSFDYVDYVLMIPGFGVPLLMLTHLASLRGLLRSKEAKMELAAG